MDYLKVDGCFSDPATFDVGYPKFTQALNATGRPILLSCEWPDYQSKIGIKVRMQLQLKCPQKYLMRHSCAQVQNLASGAQFPSPTPPPFQCCFATWTMSKTLLDNIERGRGVLCGNWWLSCGMRQYGLGKSGFSASISTSLQVHVIVAIYHIWITGLDKSRVQS